MTAEIRVVVRDVAGERHDVRVLDVGQSDEQALSQAVGSLRLWTVGGRTNFRDGKPEGDPLFGATSDLIERRDNTDGN